MINREQAGSWSRGLSVVVTLGMATAIWSCSDEASPRLADSSGADALAAYAALSAELEACENDLAACTAAAAGAADALARCESTAATCRDQTADADARAHDALSRDARRCADDDDAGVPTDDEDAGASGAGHAKGCLGEHLPNIPRCVDELVECLDAAGLRERDASRREIFECVRSAHSCIRHELSDWRAWRRAGRPGRTAAGGEAADAAAMPEADASVDAGERGSWRRHGWPSSPFERRGRGRGR